MKTLFTLIFFIFSAISFSQTVTTQEKGTFTDSHDGNVYKWVKIGKQVWMAENLKTTRFNDGTVIPLISDKKIWANLTTPGYCWYNNKQATRGNTYGALYNWYTVNTGVLCPSGWHVPSDDEWTTLVTYFGGQSVAGGKMKETGTSHWLNPNIDATDESGFSGLPGGYRYYNGQFHFVESAGFWWSSTEFSNTNAWTWSLGVYTFVSRFNLSKTYGFSIRCVKNQ